MSTIQRIDNKVFFEFKGTMITKTDKGWRDQEGRKFNGTKVANFVRGKAMINRKEVMHIRSILNRHFGYDLSFTL
jgi:hypothetical protein